jgi:DNA-binding FadR family transcriptional regulator
MSDSLSSAMGPGVIDRRSAIDAVRARIGAAIALGLLRPGERLPDQAEMAKGLSVSSITARRALATLADDGVVVRRRGRDGGTFVATDPPAAVLESLRTGTADPADVHELVDQRLLMECAVAHWAALRATEKQVGELEELTRTMAAAANWSDYHQADDRFHRLLASAARLGSAEGVYLATLDQLYEHFIPYRIDRLHAANQDHVAIVAALRSRDVLAATARAHAHIDVLHRTMFMGLAAGTDTPA